MASIDQFQQCLFCLIFSPIGLDFSRFCFPFKRKLKRFDWHEALQTPSQQFRSDIDSRTALVLSSRYKHESKLIFWGFFSQVIAINNQTYFIYSQTKNQVLFHMCSVGHSITSFFFFFLLLAHMRNAPVLASASSLELEVYPSVCQHRSSEQEFL